MKRNSLGSRSEASPECQIEALLLSKRKVVNLDRAYINRSGASADDTEGDLRYQYENKDVCAI
ncbi:MAG: hypothetical protein RI575_14645 [Balneolaceae bacterium]|nr:hypothetical protein [Balneolaceae bacterium]